MAATRRREVKRDADLAAMAAIASLLGVMAIGLALRDDGASLTPLPRQQRPPLWPQPSAAERSADAALRARVANGEIPLAEDKKPAPKSWVLNESHLSTCLSCFDDEYAASVHAAPLRPLPGVAQLFVDDHAIEYVQGVVRQVETPRKRVTNLRCPGHCEPVPEHTAKNHFGMYGSVVYERRRYRMWLGEWEPYYTESEDGVTWSRLTPLRKLMKAKAAASGGGGGRGAGGGWSPRNLCITRDPSADQPAHRYKMGYHCGNLFAEESTCLATSPDGLAWTPEPHTH